MASAKRNDLHEFNQHDLFSSLIFWILVFFYFQIENEYIILFIFNMIIQYEKLLFVLVVRKLRRFFISINENLKKTAFNYCAQWSGVEDQEIDCSIVSMGAMSHTKQRLSLDGFIQTHYYLVIMLVKNYKIYNVFLIFQKRKELQRSTPYVRKKKMHYI